MERPSESYVESQVQEPKIPLEMIQNLTNVVKTFLLSVARFVSGVHGCPIVLRHLASLPNGLYNGSEIDLGLPKDLVVLKVN